MALTARLRRLGFLALALLSLTGAAQAQFPLVLETKSVDVGSTFTLTVTSDGAIDLSGVTRRQVTFIDFTLGDPEAQRINIGARKVEATARKLVVTAGVEDTRRAMGPQQMQIFFGDVMVSFKFTVVAPFVCPASCRLPRMCVDKKCVLPPTKCNPRCKPPALCNEESKRCEVPR